MTRTWRGSSRRVGAESTWTGFVVWLVRVAVAVPVGLAAGLVAAWLGAGVASYLAVLVAATTLIPLALARRRGTRRRRIALVTVTIGLALLVGAPRPAADDANRAPSGPVLTLVDGTRLAFEVQGEPIGPGTVPLVFVHGGPGVATRTQDRVALAPLARKHTLVLYDQTGVGASSRLADPAGYTLDRAIRDLRALHAELGVRSMVLVGHSWGAVVAARFAAMEPEVVDALVLAAPADLDLTPGTPDDPSVRLAPAHRAALYARLLRPRELYAYTLTLADVSLAHSIAGDAEMDRRFSAILGRTAPAMFCDPTRASTYPTDGAGYYAHQLAEVPRPSPGPRGTRSVRVPALVVKPDCDYLPWSVIDRYVEVFGARVVRFPKAGHVLHLERPDTFSRLVIDFLGDERLPGELDAPFSAPPEYEGPS